MVATVTPYTDLRNRAAVGEGFDGVVRVLVNGFYGTGALLFDGHAILTAAHLFTSGSTSGTVIFETAAGSQSVPASGAQLQTAYDAGPGNSDLAIIWLSGSAPITAERYNPYRSSDEIGKTMTLVGYGVPGTGATGELSNYSGSPIRLKAQNQFEADASSLKAVLGAGMGWTPTPGSQLVADFDNGTVKQDALGSLLHLSGTGLGQGEGMITPGDSGGPAFINGQIAGVASYTTSLMRNGVATDIDNVSDNSSFGELAAWQRVSYYQQWIDQSLRAHYPDAPTQPGQVKKAVVEGNSGTSYAYFLVQFTGVRSDAAQLLSVDYSTRDGTAKAGQDYLLAFGTLVIYPNENQAVVPIEIMGDTTPEPDETFYLDITHPVGGSFGEGVITLTAVRTIVNDDGSFFA
ncbi:MAG: Calx-beta domain-containing protein [Polaromonas sp.]|nr:Calx-beta domain-containing protein [Polaromonas sp.]